MFFPLLKIETQTLEQKYIKEESVDIPEMPADMCSNFYDENMMDNIVSEMVPQATNSQRKILSSVEANKKRKMCIKESGSQINGVGSSVRDQNKQLQKDECTLYGELIALKLRKMDDISRVEVQHRINDILYETEMKLLKQATYTSYCTTFLEPETPSPPISPPSNEFK